MQLINPTTNEIIPNATLSCSINTQFAEVLKEIKQLAKGFEDIVNASKDTSTLMLKNVKK